MIKYSNIEEVFGGKAEGLKWLKNNEYNVPDFLPLKVSRIDDSIIIEQKLLKSSINNFLKEYHNNIAVRSSAKGEDGESNSLAGHFKTILDDINQDNIELKIQIVADSIFEVQDTDEAGVILQHKINPSFSGIIFSSNPTNGFKEEVYISYIDGYGDKLVSGHKSGKDIIVTLKNKEQHFNVDDIDFDRNILKQLVLISKEIEHKKNAPQDIEWCIEKETNELYILQCRPITTLINRFDKIFRITEEFKYKIPSSVLKNNKVDIRLFCYQKDVAISNAYIINLSGEDLLSKKDIDIIEQSELCSSYSVVLLSPKTINGNILRQFAEAGQVNQGEAYRECTRYGMRSIDGRLDLIEKVNKIRTICFEQFWSCTIIIQEIYTPKYTGIVKKLEDGYLIEVGKGHFIPKALVPTSHYLLDYYKECFDKNEIIQDHYFDICNGEVKKKDYKQKVWINSQTQKNIVDTFIPILTESRQVVEFGLLSLNDEDNLSPYMIDLVDYTPEKELSSNLISTGVMSQGIIKGRIKFLDDINNIESLQLHYHNEITEEKVHSEEIIFFAYNPDIALLEVLKKYDNKKIGFVFYEGSLLSHFPIILRERDIPAIVAKFKKEDYIEGEEITIDAQNEFKDGINRILR